jgi:hypothetical protein
LNYHELNSNQGDDFNPEMFGFEENPTPQYLTVKRHDSAS